MVAPFETGLADAWKDSGCNPTQATELCLYSQAALGGWGLLGVRLVLFLTLLIKNLFPYFVQMYQLQEYSLGKIQVFYQKFSVYLYFMNKMKDFKRTKFR